MSAKYTPLIFASICHNRGHYYRQACDVWRHKTNHFHLVYLVYIKHSSIDSLLPEMPPFRPSYLLCRSGQIIFQWLFRLSDDRWKDIIGVERLTLSHAICRNERRHIQTKDISIHHRRFAVACAGRYPNRICGEPLERTAALNRVHITYTILYYIICSIRRVVFAYKISATLFPRKRSLGVLPKRAKRVVRQ